jgi:hypothetical protein
MAMALGILSQERLLGAIHLRRLRFYKLKRKSVERMTLYSEHIHHNDDDKIMMTYIEFDSPTVGQTASFGFLQRNGLFLRGHDPSGTIIITVGHGVVIATLYV